MQHTAKLRATLLLGYQVPRGVVFMDAGSSEQILETLRTKVQGIQDQIDEIVNLADTEERDLEDDEIEKIDGFKEEIEKLDRQIQARESAARVRAGRKSPAEPGKKDKDKPSSPSIIRPQDVAKWGFKSLGEFAQSVRAFGGDNPNGEAGKKLQNALTTYANEGTGADGGFLVPPDFRRDVMIKVLGEESFISRTDRLTTSSNSIVIPTDETTPWGSTGVQAYWESEAGQKTQSKPVFGQNSVRLNKLIALVPVTDEMLQDAPQIDSYLRRKVPEVMTAKLNTALLFGTGAGQPLGMLNSPALITVAKEVSQAADSVVFENIVNMYSRMAAASIPRSVWLINQALFPELIKMRFDTTSSVPIPVYLPGGNIAGAPFGTLLGRPVFPMEAMKIPGDVGDIALVDPTQYLSVTKGQDIQTDVSMHLFFDYDITAFRFVLRVAGQPWWKSAIQPQQSAAPTLGHFIVLADRT